MNLTAQQIKLTVMSDRCRRGYFEMFTVFMCNRIERQFEMSLSTHSLRDTQNRGNEKRLVEYGQVKWYLVKLSTP